MAGVAKSLPGLSSIAGAVLRSRGGEEVRAATLWAKQPVLFFVLRRPGCVLCRDTAKKVYGARGAFEAAGVRLACVAHEWLPAEIAAFNTDDYWPGEVYLDADKAFYKAFSEDGKSVRRQSALTLLNPLNSAWGRIMAARKNVADHNTTGDGTVLGGLLLVRAGEGGVAYAHAEKTFGEFPEIEQVLADVKAALGQ
ncbi:hypothetical protein Rsub_07698 [Raphidocelis subcapitata]|uniref:Peroxiredoxin-like 2A n=1 Tax=Raphidocelis subcapitata TaxID=307507 RepID=A0A2V0P5G8_9CHLO|nr:hypothetical protein Rsub_07698 [Raphidocelis subcapitata]|eukprot:GBF95114.1 hypothetical protein Rsub_07698 [Raphidocelis subcapitata]